MKINGDEMKKICMITPNFLPVPSVKGGAVETLVTNLIEQNEIGKKLDITVYSIYDSQAESKAKEYEYTKIKYIKVKANNILERWKSKITGNGVLSKVLKKALRINEYYYAYKIEKKIQPELYDSIVIEGRKDIGI